MLALRRPSASLQLHSYVARMGADSRSSSSDAIIASANRLVSIHPWIDHEGRSASSFGIMPGSFPLASRKTSLQTFASGYVNLDISVTLAQVDKAASSSSSATPDDDKDLA